MNIVCLDMEGVLVPEIWIAFAEESGIPELRRTTRDEPDYDKLMRWRIDLLRERGLKLSAIQETISRIDPRVNINESNQMVDALRKRGVHVDYMVKDNEGHGFHNEENRFDFYRAMEKFLGKYLKGIEPEGEIVPESSRR